MLIDHIGYVVKNIERSIERFSELGYTQATDIIFDDIDYNGYTRNIKICFMLLGTNKIELVAPLGKNSEATKLLAKYGESPYHICYKTENLENEVCKMVKKGWLVLKPPTKSIAFNQNRVAFLYCNSVGIIELLELKNG